MIININDNISYIKASDDPLSADVVFIKSGMKTWIYDVGNNDESFQKIIQTSGEKAIVISHFHPDHMGNLGRIMKETSDIELYVGDNTFKYTNQGTVVTDELWIEGGLECQSDLENHVDLECQKVLGIHERNGEQRAFGIHIFALPSSHAKGSLGLEFGDYAFLGDGTYPTHKKGKVVFNAQILLEQIKVLEKLNAKYFVLSHDREFVLDRGQVLSQLHNIYETRQKNDPFIEVKF